MKWLRLYSEARNDAKLEALSDAQFRVWFRLLCLANEQTERGTIANFSPRLLAVEVAHGDVALLSETLELLSELRIVETSEGMHRFVNWNKRQFASDDVYTRVQAHRERNSNVPVTAKKQSETFQKRFRNVNETAPDTDTDTDTDTERVSPKKEKITSSSSRSKRAVAAADAGGKREVSKPLDPIWDALCEATNTIPVLKAERSKRGGVVKELKSVGATPQQVLARAARYRVLFPNATLTDTALAKHWSECDPSKPLPMRPASNGHHKPSEPERPLVTADAYPIREWVPPGPDD